MCEGTVSNELYVLYDWNSADSARTEGMELMLLWALACRGTDSDLGISLEKFQLEETSRESDSEFGSSVDERGD
ncbi:unnamed protein product, partial [Nesidiocoris tenuis]